MCSPRLTCALVPCACGFVRLCVRWCVSIPVPFFAPPPHKMSSLCRRVCVLICLVSVLITLIMRPSGVCVCATVCLAPVQSVPSQPSSYLPVSVCVRACMRVCVHIGARVCVRMLAGMTVSAIKDGSGMLVRSVVQGGSVSQDGRLGVGDAILAIDGEPTSDLNNARARAMLRRHSVMGPELR